MITKTINILCTAFVILSAIITTSAFGIMVYEGFYLHQYKLGLIFTFGTAGLIIGTIALIRCYIPKRRIIMSQDTASKNSTILLWEHTPVGRIKKIGEDKLND